MRPIYNMILGIILAANVGIMSAQEVEYQKVKYEILDGGQVRVKRASPYKRLLRQYSGKVYIPDSIYINNSAYYVTDVTDAFRGCKYLQEVRLPRGLTYIINCAFASCISLQHIELPDSVQTIYNYAFYGCYSLHTIKLSANIQRIDVDAFEGCKKLREIYIKAIIPPRIEGYQDYGMLTPVLIDVDTSILIHIPSGTKKLYQSAPGWSLFTNFVDDL